MVPVTYLYLSGPMRGIAEFNFPAFRAAAEGLRSDQYNIVSPHEKDIESGFTAEGLTGYENLADLGFDLYAALAWDMAAIATPECIGVACLPGWRNSSGARAEVALALALGTSIYGVVLDGRPSGKPWLIRIKPMISVTSEVEL
jgi:hypothetical protein